MEETLEERETAVSSDAPLNFAMFNKLSPGVQRLVIAVLFVIVMVLAVVARELMKAQRGQNPAESIQ
mgnify:FL=1